MLVFLAAVAQFQSGALQLSAAVESALGVVPLSERAKPIFETLPEMTDANQHPGELSSSIEINHVNFRYHADLPLVLRDVSFAVNPGQFVAVVGPSCGGKSSLLRLLLGFERTESDSGMILDNIVGSAPLIIDDAWEAAQKAGLEEDISGTVNGQKKRTPMNLMKL